MSAIRILARLVLHPVTQSQKMRPRRGRFRQEQMRKEQMNQVLHQLRVVHLRQRRQWMRAHGLSMRDLQQKFRQEGPNNCGWMWFHTRIYVKIWSQIYLKMHLPRPRRWAAASSASLSECLVIEIFAGTGRVTASLKALGLAATV